MSDDFAIVPESDIKDLKDQISSIKRNPLGPYGGQDLIEAVGNLTRAINSLMQLFETAAEELKMEERESDTIVRKIDPLLARIEAISDQNRKIAQGVVAVADMVDAMKPLQMPAPMPRPETPPPIPSPMPMAPRPMPSPQNMQQQMPPPPGQRPQLAGIKLPPVPPPRKKGLFR